MTRSRVRGLALARGLWVILAVVMAVLWLASVPVFLQHVAAGTVPTIELAGTLQVSHELFQQAADAWGISLPAWAWLDTLVSGFSLLVFYSLSGLILWRVKTWFGWFTATILLVGGSNGMSHAVYTAQLSQPLITLWQLGALVWPFFMLWLYLFPDGRPVPRRLLWLLAPALMVFLAAFIIFTIATFIPLSEANEAQLQRLGSGPISIALIPLLFVLALFAQVYRYRKVSGSVEREQVKWFIYGLLVAFLPLTLIESVTPLPGEIDTLFFLGIPAGIAIAILRHRLWDIDIIIRRTLVYSILTALLALFYFGSVVVLQRLFTAVSGQSSAVALVISTLAIAALFTPLRRRVQDAIDRRFYRRKYDAAKTLAAFSATVRDETNLDNLTGELLAIVQETMQPEHVSLWMKTTADGRPRTEK
ncbi:MAG: hypothetical protein IT330_01125 [Anaerolineae bacterium]|nr:hypothetical protein [Anaerolineae bacterium]